MEKQVLTTDIKEYPLFTRGKVRDVYDLDDKLLIVTSDRISAFDVVMPQGIPGKGKILTQMSLFWFKMVEDIVPNHIYTSDFNDFPEDLQKYREELDGRSIIVKKADRLDIECIVRGYITGSGWEDYKSSGKICGISLPENLKESEKLSTPLFTPSSKAELGDHDENIDFDSVVKIIGMENAEKVKNLTIDIYEKASDYALSKGIIIADTKFEFGIIDGEVCLIDEILSPDSSRFWPKEQYEVGKGQLSFDKQYLRDYLNSLDWDKKAPGPDLPNEIIEKTLEKYTEAFNLICK